MPTITTDPMVHQNIINEINSIHGDHTIIAFNNQHTPLSVVFYVLCMVVPLSQEEAYNKAMEIHMMGKGVVYKGSRDHCEKIGKALTTIKVEYKIE
jgi:ATP-dependent Clp protease adapter protein ClpS